MTGSRSGLPVMGAALDPRVLVTWCATVGTAWHCRLEGAARELLVGAHSSGPLRHCARGHTSTNARTRSLTWVLPPWPLSAFSALRLLGVDARLARPLTDVVCGKIARVGCLELLHAGDDIVALPAKSSTNKEKAFSQVVSCFAIGLRMRRISECNCSRIDGMEPRFLAKPVFGVSPVHTGALFHKPNNGLAKAAW